MEDKTIILPFKQGFYGFINVGIGAAGVFVEFGASDGYFEFAVGEKVFHPFAVLEEGFSLIVLADEITKFTFSGMGIGKMPVSV